MNDRAKVAREIAARTEPRFIEIPAERRTKRAGPKPTRFIEIPRGRRGGRVPFTEAELTAMRGGLTAEEYRRKTIRKWGKR
jgi:hypothetical protein